jgi:cobyrinic acid a,c-diamide synthase
MPSSNLSCPRLLVAGLGGGSGKTIVSLGLVRVLADQGLSIQTFKKGPDYLDAKWLSLAGHGATTNLDPFLFSAEVLQNIFWQRVRGADLALIEGNRGLYDGKDVQGTYSSAELAKSRHCPVIVVVDCTKVTRTMAAVILGLRAFDSAVDIRGVILNRTAGRRHQNILRQAIERYTDVPVLGILPKFTPNPIPERQMGLVSDGELDTDPFSVLAACIRDHVDVDGCLAIARSAPAVVGLITPIFPGTAAVPSVRIGIARDAALQFYYRENLDALRHAGAELVEFSLLTDAALPSVDAVYMGGGFPETMVQELSANQSMRESVLTHVREGMPVYAECGGLMYLGSSLHCDGVSYPMVGVFPLETRLFQKPQGHGYMQSVVTTPNPFFPLGASLSGHEFHYSRCMDREAVGSFVFQVQRGHGMGAGWDGALFRNCLAGYTHIHALGNPDWAIRFTDAARVYAQSQGTGNFCPDIRI